MATIQRYERTRRGPAGTISTRCLTSGWVPILVFVLLWAIGLTVLSSTQQPLDDLESVSGRGGYDSTSEPLLTDETVEAKKKKVLLTNAAKVTDPNPNRLIGRKPTPPISPTIRLWSGEALRVPPMNSTNVSSADMNLQKLQTIEMAVAYCKADLKWLKDAVANELPKQSYIKITILSKCGSERTIPTFDDVPNVNVEIVKLPNKGGCDLAFAHFIKNYMNRETSLTGDSSIIMFLKDTPRTKKNCHQRGRYRTMEEMLNVSSHGDFICGIKPECSMSAFHDTRLLKSFSKNFYRRHGDKKESGADFNSGGYKDLKDFIAREFDEWSFPNDEVTEVCYGGSFALPALQLFADERLRGVFNRLEEILMEGSSMSVVEHFAERLWASLLANPLSPKDTDSIIHMRQGIKKEQGRYMGTFISNATCNES